MQRPPLVLTVSCGNRALDWHEDGQFPVSFESRRGHHCSSKDFARFSAVSEVRARSRKRTEEASLGLPNGNGPCGLSAEGRSGDRNLDFAASSPVASAP
jgi:hypothetical protein